MKVPMKKSAQIGVILGSLIPLTFGVFGCTYEAPQASSSGGAGGATSSSSSGAGGSSGQGSGGSCDPGASKFCMDYSGPAGTEGIGACIASTSECLTSGTWAPCLAEVVPTVETCANKASFDSNCDGLLPCLGSPLRSNPFPDGQSGKNEFIIALGAGNGSKGHDGPIYAVGGRKGFNLRPLDLFSPLLWQLDNDGIMHDFSGKFDFVNKTDPDGALATGVGVIPSSGDVIVSGFYVGGILSIGGETFTQAGLDAISYVARFSSTGSVVNKRMLNTEGNLTAQAMTVDSLGNTYIVGSYSGTPVVGAKTFDYADKPHGFILALDSVGDYLWHQTLGGTGAHETVAIANVSDTYLVIATRYAGNLSILDPMGVTFPPDAGVEPDILVSRLQIKTGLATWNSSIAGSGPGGDIGVGGLAADDNHVVITGQFANTVNINGLTHTNPNGIGSADSFIATLAMGTGAFVAQTPVGGVGIQDVRGVAIDSAGDVIITGAYSEQLTLKVDTIFPSPTNGIDSFVIKTDKFYTRKWPEPRIFGGGNEQRAQAVIVGKQAGYIYVGGAFVQEFGWPNGLVKSAGDADAFLITLSD